MSSINLTEFLQVQKFLKFDYLLGFTKKSEDGKVLKIPIREAKNFTDPDVKINELPLIQSVIKNPTKVNYPIVGIIMKNMEGLKIYDKHLICIDVDAKGQPEKGLEIYDKVVKYLCDTLKFDKEKLKDLSEKTISGGYHIFLTSNKLYPQKKLLIERGVEIEIFSNNRYIAVAPSEHYEALNSTSCVNFNDAYHVSVNCIDLDHFCNEFEKEKEEEKKELEINDDFIFDENSWNRVVKGWKELDKFIDGKNDSDWEDIHESSSYNYVRNNIMPVYTLYGQIDEFIAIVEKYGKIYVKQWKNYPARWLEKWDSGVRILGGDAKRRLGKAGLFQKKKPTTKQDIIQDFVTCHMSNLFKYVLIIYDAVYYYNEDYKCYVYLETGTFEEVLGLYYTNTLKIILKPDDYHSLHETFRIYAKVFCIDPAHTNYITYDILRDKTYYERIPIVFRNGTLYISSTATYFEAGKFDPYDKALFAIQDDYTVDMLKMSEDSVVVDWFNTKFTEKDLDFIQMFFGNLLVPAYSPSLMLVLYSYKGALGKSTLAKTLSSIFDIKSNAMITTLPLSHLGDRFGGGNLSRALLNITTELDGNIDAETFKNVVSREKWMVENKFQNLKFELPLAKHISMAQDVPRISADGGVTRRLGVFEVSEQKAMKHIEAHQYEEMFMADTTNLIAFMLQGLLKLKALNFADLSNYYRINFAENINMLREYNSNVYEWAGLEGLDCIKTASDQKDKKGLTEDECYILYNTWCTTNDVKALRKRTMMKYLLSIETLTRSRPVVNGERVCKLRIKE